MLLHTTLIIDDVNILTVWHKLAYCPVGDRVSIAVILVSWWIAGGQPVEGVRYGGGGENSKNFLLTVIN